MIGASKAVHQLVMRFRVEELFVHLRKRASLLRKFIPLRIRHKFTSFGRFVPPSSSYPKHDSHHVTRDGTNFLVNRSDYVQWRIFYGVRDNALRYAKVFLTNDSIVLDVGANCGAFSLKLAAHLIQNRYSNVTIHAFEPNPMVYATYNSNLSLNPGFEKIIKPHPVGFGSEHGRKAFQYPISNTGVGRVLQSGKFSSTTVCIERLDDFVSSINPPRISFIKLIVEGYEPEVLKGGWNTVKKYKPIIFFEATNEWYEQNNSSVKNVLSELSGLGYHFQGELHNEMIPYDSATFASVYQFNVLAIPHS
jgi:FkbM family methyltransferase